MDRNHQSLNPRKGHANPCAGKRNDSAQMISTRTSRPTSGASCPDLARRFACFLATTKPPEGCVAASPLFGRLTTPKSFPVPRHATHFTGYPDAASWPRFPQTPALRSRYDASMPKACRTRRSRAASGGRGRRFGASADGSNCRRTRHRTTGRRPAVWTRRPPGASTPAGSSTGRLPASSA
jgi:hypothetical protein